MSGTRIDVHTHYLSRKAGALLADIGFTLRGGYTIGRWSEDLALEFMDRASIEAQVLSMPSMPAAREAPPGLVTRFARTVNDELAELRARNPQRFGAFATIPLDRADTALTEIEYGLDELQLDGVVLTSNADGRYFGHPFWEPILAELERRQVPVFIHPTDCLCIDELRLNRPSSVIEFPFDTARNITNALYTGVFQRYQRLRLILAHNGGALPGLVWRIAEHAEMGRGPADADVDPDHIRAVVSGLYFETALAGSDNVMASTLAVTSPDHILFGTDFPAAREPTIMRNIDALSASDRLSPTELEGIERNNALRLFPNLAVRGT